MRYIDYIGDGDSKTYKGIVEFKPYGEKVQIKKKECIVRKESCSEANGRASANQKKITKALEIKIS